MTFGEHLEELRSTLVKAMISLAFGVAASLYFTPTVVQFLQTPVERAIRQFRIAKARAEIEKQYGFVPDDQAFLLAEYNLVPKEIRINPAELLQLLQAYRPELVPQPIDEIEFTGLHLPLAQVGLLAERLLEQDLPTMPAVEAAAVRAIATRLTAEERGLLEEVRQLPASERLPSHQVRALAILNRLLKSEDLYRDPSFEPILAAEEPSWLTTLWNSFWQIDPGAESTLSKIKATFEVDRDVRVVHRLHRTLLERLVLPSATGSQFQSLTLWEPAQASTVALGSGEAFMIYLKAALLTGTIVAGPFIFYFLWTFVAAGLYPQEQRYVYFYLPFSLSLFAAGVMVAFVFAFEPVLNFLFSFNMMLGIDPQPRIGEWLSFVMLLPLGFGIAFQLPLVMLLLFRIGLISLETYISQWRMAILIIAVISMLATPADPISMVLLGGPLVVLYLFGILLCRFLPANRRVFAEGYDPV